MAIAFTDGLAAVRLNGKIGFIDKKGTMVVPAYFDDTSHVFGWIFSQ